MTDIIDVAEYTAASLEDAIDTFRLVNDFAERESDCFGADEKTEKLRSVCFTRRFSTFLKTYDMIVRDLEQHKIGLDKAIKTHYENNRAGNC